MPITEKYQSLPGLDTWSPDVFETGDGPNTESDSIPLAAPEPENEDIDYTNISPNAARERFLNRAFKPDDDAVDNGGFIAREPESLEMKIERLRKEISEVSAALEGKKEEGEREREVAEMNEAMRTIMEASRSGSLITKIASELAGGGSSAKSAEEPSETQGSVLPSREEQSIPPKPTIPDSKLLDLDARLATLEKALGSTSSILFTNTFQTTVFEQPVIPTLLSLSQRVSAFTASPEKISALIETVNAQQKSAAEREKKVVGSSGSRSTTTTTIRPSSGDVYGNAAEGEYREKIDQLYASLQNVEKLATIVPGLLDRLMSLRYIHAEAGNVVGSVEELRKEMTATEGLVGKWKDAVDGAEKRLDALEEREKSNLQTVEEWVKELEKKTAGL
ncbi:hypothetical protein BZA70DRAFT_277347 [Myxozyma melibiosi]|uniref:Uncharacterized protein n=1 Tax=Myxozyma melibiosi TaxID=54550 RepID=A0ABR1F7V3_9ASCO